MIAAFAAEALPAPSGLQPILAPRYPALRRREDFDREYLLDVAAAATARPRPGSLPACWPLLDDREHIEAICRDYGELDVDHRLVAEQLDEAQRRAVAAEHARDEAQRSLAEAVEELAVEREQHAATAELLSAAQAGALRLLLRDTLLLAELALTQLAMAETRQRYQALRVDLLMLEVSDELHAEKRPTHRGQSSEFATVDGVDGSHGIDVDERVAMGGAR